MRTVPQLVVAFGASLIIGSIPGAGSAEIIEKNTFLVGPTCDRKGEVTISIDADQKRSLNVVITSQDSFAPNEDLECIDMQNLFVTPNGTVSFTGEQGRENVGSIFIQLK